MAGPPAVIVCVDCGGRAHLVQEADPESPYTEGDIATYRCEDCLDRWDIVLTEDDDDEAGRGDDPTPDRSSSW